MPMELVTNLPYDHPYRWDGSAFGGPMLWRPSAIPRSQLALWLDAEDSSSITLNGSTVSQWNDKSGNGRNVAQATAANQPTYNTTTFNGKPALVFDGSNDFISRSGVVLNDSDIILFLAIRYRNATTALQSVVSTDDTGSSPRIYLQADAGTLKGYGGNYISAGTYTANTMEVTSISRLASGDIIQVYRNGTLSGSGAGGIATANNGLKFGLLGTGAFGAHASVDIAESIAVNAVLSTGTRQRLEGYLAWKWGLQENLPSTHPYKNLPPTV